MSELVVVSLRLDPQVVDELRAQAEVEGISVSEVVRRCIDSGFNPGPTRVVRMMQLALSGVRKAREKAVQPGTFTARMERWLNIAEQMPMADADLMSRVEKAFVEEFGTPSVEDTPLDSRASGRWPR